MGLRDITNRERILREFTGAEKNSGFSWRKGASRMMAANAKMQSPRRAAVKISHFADEAGSPEFSLANCKKRPLASKIADGTKKGYALKEHRHAEYVLAVLIAAATFLVYLRTLQNGFINWDEEGIRCFNVFLSEVGFLMHFKYVFSIHRSDHMFHKNE